MIILLKFFMSEVFAALNGSLIQFFNTANVLMSGVGNVGNGFDANYLIPR